MALFNDCIACFVILVRVFERRRHHIYDVMISLVSNQVHSGLSGLGALFQIAYIGHSASMDGTLWPLFS